MKNTIGLGRMIKELRPGETLTFQIPKSFFDNCLDSENLCVKVTHEMKQGRSCRLSIEAPKTVAISSKP